MDTFCTVLVFLSHLVTQMSKSRKSSTFYFNTNSKKKKKSFWRPKVGWKLIVDTIPKIMDFTS